MVGVYLGFRIQSSGWKRPGRRDSECSHLWLSLRERQRWRRPGLQVQLKKRTTFFYCGIEYHQAPYILWRIMLGRYCFSCTLALWFEGKGEIKQEFCVLYLPPTVSPPYRICHNKNGLFKQYFRLTGSLLVDSPAYSWQLCFDSGISGQTLVIVETWRLDLGCAWNIIGASKVESVQSISPVKCHVFEKLKFLYIRSGGLRGNLTKIGARSFM